MTDTASRIYGPAQPADSNATLYTVPGSTTAVVRNIHVTNTTAVAATFNIAINGTSATAANCFIRTLSVPGGSTYDWSGFLVVPTGETITGLQGTASSLTVTISAVLVT